MRRDKYFLIKAQQTDFLPYYRIEMGAATPKEMEGVLRFFDVKEKKGEEGGWYLVLQNVTEQFLTQDGQPVSQPVSDEDARNYAVDEAEWILSKAELESAYLRLKSRPKKPKEELEKEFFEAVPHLKRVAGVKREPDPEDALRFEATLIEQIFHLTQRVQKLEQALEVTLDVNQALEENQTGVLPGLREKLVSALAQLDNEVQF